MKIALASVLLAACAQVSQPDNDDTRAIPEPNGGTFGTLAEPEPEPQPLEIEAPKAATGPSSLFAMTFAAGSPIDQVVIGGAAREVVVQRIVTATDTEVDLAVELAPPTGNFTRSIVSDTHQVAMVAETVLCSFKGAPIINNQHKCITTAPALRETPAQGPITASQWRLSVVDELTGTRLSTCSSPGPNRIECVLPPRAGLAYRVVVSATGFANLWDGTSGFGGQTLDGVEFTGAFLPARDFQCFDFGVNGFSLSCLTRLEFDRFVALDRATLAFDPITLRIAANGVETEAASPALQWDSGNDDVPGATF